MKTNSLSWNTPLFLIRNRLNIGHRIYIARGHLKKKYHHFPAPGSGWQYGASPLFCETIFCKVSTFYDAIMSRLHLSQEAVTFSETKYLLENRIRTPNKYKVAFCQFNICFQQTHNIFTQILSYHQQFEISSQFPPDCGVNIGWIRLL